MAKLWVNMSIDERTQAVSDGAEKRLSAAAIGRALSCSRSAILGHGYRRGIKFSGFHSGGPPAGPRGPRGKYKPRKKPTRKRSRPVLPPQPETIKPIGVAFTDRALKQCAWIINDDMKTAVCCGHPVMDDFWQPYCEGHAALSVREDRR